MVNTSHMSIANATVCPCAAWTSDAGLLQEETGEAAVGVLHGAGFAFVPPLASGASTLRAQPRLAASSASSASSSRSVSADQACALPPPSRPGLSAGSDGLTHAAICAVQVAISAAARRCDFCAA